MAEQAVTSGLQVKVKDCGTEIEVRCIGRLVLGTNSVLYDCVHELIPGKKHIVVECSELTRMDSTGLGTLVRLYASAKGKGCTLEMVNMGPSIRHLLGITQLLGVLTTIGENNIRIV